MNDDLRAAVSNLSRVVDDWLGLSEIMREDLRLLIEALAKDDANQMLRRSFVRASWAYVESITYSIKHFLFTACQLGSEHLTKDDHAFLSEQRLLIDPEGQITVRRDATNALDNVKRTFRIAEKLLEVGWTPDFGDSGWHCLRKSIGTRHRLTHPKSVAEVSVTNEDYEDMRVGIAWFVQTFTFFETAILHRYVAKEP